MALPGSGAISASMIRTELNIPSQVPFSLSSASLVHYSDLNALSISSSGDILDITDPNAIGEWKNYDHTFTRSLAPYTGLRVPYGYPYTTFAQVNVGTTSAVIPFTASNFVSSGLAPRNEVSYSLFYTTYSLNIKQSGKLIQKGLLTVAAPSSSFTYNYNASSGSVVTFLFRESNGAWSSQSGLIQARGEQLGGAGTQNAALAFGGFISLVGGSTCTEEYNGSSWAAGGALITARWSLTGVGTQNEALAFGGFNGTPSTFCTNTEEYNGSSWAAGGALITGRAALAGAGTQNAGLAFSGIAPGLSRCTEEYNGSSWTAGGAIITGRCNLAGTGIQNAALAIGGSSPSGLAFTEEYNGTSWTAGGALICARYGLAGSGTQNDSLVFGGDNTPTNVCNISERYNGTNWSTDARLNIARRQLAGAGDSSTTALAFGGSIPSGDCVTIIQVNYTEAYLLN